MKALITGVTGQDGSYLADFLLEKGYEVYGLVRRSSTDNKWRIKKALSNGLILLDGDITDTPSLQFIFKAYGPFDECYNLAAQSDVGLSWKQPLATAKITGLGCLNLLEAIKTQNPECKFYQASTSELYGGCNSNFKLTEDIPFHPRSPYACAKAYAHHITVNYRESFGLFAACGILFNHESPRRGDNFVTQKIVKAGVRIKAGQQDTLNLGNLDAMRDWSHAKDMVRGMWMILQNEKAEEFVLSSGKTHSVRYFLDIVFSKLELPIEKHVIIDQDLYRPAEVHILCGDSTKARNILGWVPEYDLEAIVDDMIAGE